ncbi:MAG TPA: PAS domain S-box protein, partial [Candidatus Micrarchaeota archaeon]|nr:PAS domain S-box protein [Candidatus Micrarchaeota archaeon]
FQHPGFAITARTHEKMRAGQEPEPAPDSNPSIAAVAKCDSDSRYKMLFDTSPAGFFNLLCDTNKLEINASLRAMLGYAPTADLSKMAPVDFFSSPVEFNLINSMLVTNGELNNVYSYLSKADGKVLPVTLSVHRIKGNYVFGTVLDMTDYVDTQNELRSAKTSAEKLNSNLKLLFKRISHDLRSPFNGLLGSMDALVNDKDMDKETHDLFIKMAYSGAKNAYNFVVKLLEWARVSSDTLKFFPVERNIISAELYQM